MIINFGQQTQSDFIKKKLITSSETRKKKNDEIKKETYIEIWILASLDCFVSQQTVSLIKIHQTSAGYKAVSLPRISKRSKNKKTSKFQIN